MDSITNAVLGGFRIFSKPFFRTSVFIIHKFSYHYLGISILWGLGHKWILRVLPWFIIHRINLYDVGVVLRTFYASIEPHVDSYDLSFTYSKLQWFIGMLILFLCIFQTSYICTFIYLTKIRNQNVNWKKKYRNLKEQLKKNIYKEKTASNCLKIE